MRLTNLTPHPVVIVLADGVLQIPVDGPAARVVERREPVQDLVVDRPGLVDGGGQQIEVTTIGYADEIAHLPSPQEDHCYVVSRIVAAASDRTDLVFPDREVRDADGRIVGCRGLARFERR